MEPTPKFSTYQEVLTWMDHSLKTSIQPSLDRMQWLMERLGYPQRRLKFIHIAGTNGKGSTAAMIASVLKEAGYPTGMYISPHVTSWNERIQFDGQPISEESFVHWSNYLYPWIEEMIQEGNAHSPFEFWTALAIVYFAKEALPWFVVWETGLGGRWDATNVVYPLVSVITQIGLDHNEWLGNTVSDIAREKAGIIKAGVPVISAQLSPEALEVIQHIAQEKKARLYLEGKEFHVRPLEVTANGSLFDFTNIYRTLPRLHIPLIGEHQLHNAAVALMTLEVLRQSYATVIDPEHFEDGLKKVKWPGRMEKVSDEPWIILDGAHNPDGLKAALNTVKYQLNREKFGIVMAIMQDKAVEEMLDLIGEYADWVVATEVDHPRSMKAKQLQEALVKKYPDLPIYMIPSISETCSWLKEHMKQSELCLITGSLFLVSEVRSILAETEME